MDIGQLDSTLDSLRELPWQYHFSLLLIKTKLDSTLDKENKLDCFVDNKIIFNKANNLGKITNYW